MIAMRIGATFALLGLVTIGVLSLYAITYTSHGGARERIREVGLSIHTGPGSQRNEVTRGDNPGNYTKYKRPNDSEQDYLIPGDEALGAMTDTKLMEIYWRYINRIQILCRDVVRVGNLKDGGKEICEDEPYRPKSPCLVYSFGINYMFDFDNAVVRRYGCEVHCFDPSMNTTRTKPGRVYENVYFHDWGLGDIDTVNNKQWTIKTLQSIRRHLGHTNRTIDLLKIDIEGDEWPSIPQMLSSGAIDDVRQISMETHFSKEHPHTGGYWGNTKPDKQLRGLRLLYEADYRIFVRERNLWSHHMWPGIAGYITNVNEISLIKVKR